MFVVVRSTDYERLQQMFGECFLMALKHELQPSVALRSVRLIISCSRVCFCRYLFTVVVHLHGSHINQRHFIHTDVIASDGKHGCKVRGQWVGVTRGYLSPSWLGGLGRVNSGVWGSSRINIWKFVLKSIHFQQRVWQWFQELKKQYTVGLWCSEGRSLWSPWWLRLLTVISAWLFFNLHACWH